MKHLITSALFICLFTSCRTINTSFVQARGDEKIKMVVGTYEADESVFPGKQLFKTRMDVAPGDRCIVKLDYGLEVIIVQEVKEFDISIYDRTKYRWLTNKLSMSDIKAGEAEDQGTRANIRKRLNEREYNKVLGK